MSTKTIVDPFEAYTIGAYTQHETRRGVQFSAEILYLGCSIGELTNDGDGGGTAYRIKPQYQDLWNRVTSEFLKISDVDPIEPADMILEWLQVERDRGTLLNQLQETVFASILS